MADELVFVQFPHPGGEHHPNGDVMDWNRGPHARKFLQATGDYLDGGEVRTGYLGFWGEWEPQSRVVATFSEGPPGSPRWLHEPHWEVPRHRALLQNSDPLVFGDSFLYSNCRQGRNRKLRALAPGSLIAFGSKYQREFVVDTVFAVGGESEQFVGASANEVDADEWVRAVVFDPLSRSEKAAHQPFRLYRGVTQGEAPSGPFSFVPCQPIAEAGSGFPRPALRLQHKWIQPNLAMGAKVTTATPGEIQELWGDIVNQITSAGLSMAVRLDPPPHVSALSE